MKYYLAPLEGITGYIYRNAYQHYFHNIDKYFTPFIIPKEGSKFKGRELNDILPEHNKNMKVVPQILTNNSEGFIKTARELMEFGYDEINLNLGCPSGTVVSKSKGSGFLAKKEELDKFLYEIFSAEDLNISIKTRIGKDSTDEVYDLIEIYNKYPISELTIHPRTQKDFYGGIPHLDIFKNIVILSNNTLCYNGNIFTKDDYNNIKTMFPEVDAVMLGRGIIANPGLIGEIREDKTLNKDVLKDFHDEILDGYRSTFSGDKNVLFKMKELWSYMIYIFSDNKKYLKKIKKSQNLNEYKVIVNNLFNEQEIIRESGLFGEQFANYKE